MEILSAVQLLIFNTTKGPKEFCRHLPNLIVSFMLVAYSRDKLAGQGCYIGYKTYGRPKEHKGIDVWIWPELEMEGAAERVCVL